jgi:ABC-type tungstate transport system permease subunit
LAAASAQGAYTLTSRRTFASLPAALQIQPLLEADPTLLRTYSTILVNPENAPGVNASGASALADYLARPDIQQVISEFRVAQSATQVFFPQPQ